MSEPSYHPQPLAMYNSDWRHRPVGLHGVMMEIGKYYWVHRRWNNYPVEKTRFLQVTPKGYAFVKMDGRRMFHRPIYPNKLFVKQLKKVMVEFIPNITIYSEDPNAISPTEETTVFPRDRTKG